MARLFQKGNPKIAGRKKGTPNRISVDARTLASQIVTNPVYQARLRRDVERRKVHPQIESLLWQYHLGRPVQPVLMGGSLDVTAKHTDARRQLAALPLHQLEQLAAQSAALVSQALAAAPQHVVAESVTPAQDAESLTNVNESDNESFVNKQSDPADPADPPPDE